MTRTVAVSGVALPLGQSIAQAALLSPRGHRVVVTDLHDEDAAVVPGAVFRRGVHVNDANYLERMARVLREEGVDLFVPGAEIELRRLSGCRARFEAEAGCRVMTNADAVLASGQDKLATSRLLERAGLPFARTVALDDDLESALTAARAWGYPCIAKGRTAGAPILVSDDWDVEYVQRKCEDYVLQEYLGGADGSEYTWGVFRTERDGIVASFGLQRTLRYGLTWRAQRIEDAAMAAYVEQAVTALGAVGPVNVQLRRRDDGTPVVHEFNVRCSSSTVFRALCGWNEIDMAIDWLVEGRAPRRPENVRTTGIAVRAFTERWFDREAENT